MQSASGPDMTSNVPQTPLTNAAAFWLIATLMLGGVFQPSSGSLVLGPTSRYWRCSPISSAVEVWTICWRLLRAVFLTTKNCYEIATHPDARLTDARRAHIEGSRAEDASSISRSPSLSAKSEDIDDVVEVDLADGRYELVGGSEGSEEVSRDEEASRDEEVGEVLRAQTLERLKVFNFLWLATMKKLAYCIITSRAMNAPSGSQKYRELCDIRDNITKRYEFYQRMIREINEGWRFRLGVCFPIIAQFIKVMVVQGITLPKILAVIYFVHWLILELLLTLASRCCCNPKDLVMSVDAYLNKSYRSFESDEWAIADARQASLREDTTHESSSDESNVTVSEAASDDTLAEIQLEVDRWRFDQWENALVYTHMMVTLILCFGISLVEKRDGADSSVSWYKGLLAITLFAALFLYFNLSPKHVLIKGQPDGMIKPSKRTPFNYRRRSRRKNDPIYGGYVVGGDLGIASLIWWLFYCLAFYDSKETHRPSWPWLDILG